MVPASLGRICPHQFDETANRTVRLARRLTFRGVVSSYCWKEHTIQRAGSDLEAIADRVEIEALRGEFTDAVMMRDYDRVASLFTHDGALRMPNIPADLADREEIRAWGERCRLSWTTPDGWKFTERVYEVRYHDTTPRHWRARRPAQRAAGGAR
jgi:hypothetical protein